MGARRNCTVQFVSPYSQQVGTQYVLTGWQDGSTANPRTIITPAQSTTYTATFKTQYQTSVLVSPTGAGTVIGDGWVDAGGAATLTATAATGYRFVNWSGSTFSSANPVSFQLNSPQTITANFTPVTNATPGNWSAMLIVAGGIGCAINSFGEVVGQSGNSPFLWTPVAANSVAGTLLNLSSVTSMSGAVAVNDDGQILFSQYRYLSPVSRCVPEGATSLWTPTVPQGTTGNLSTISTDNSSSMGALNNFGQVGASVNGNPGIWTPAAPNGTSGTFTANTQLQGLQAINSYGQVIANSPSPVLFTPQARNGATGTLTSVPGLAGATQSQLTAINETGTVIGYSCVTQISSGCQNQGFIWAPSSANGPAGTIVAMPMPSGFVSVTPTDINAAGSVVGTMTPSTGNAIPFLYTAGIYYDLTTISGVPVGATPVGINHAGQIILNSSNYSNNLYLLTPISAPVTPPPGAVSVTINANTGAVFTVTGTGCAPGGYTTPQTLQWAPSAICTIQFVSPYSQQVGTHMRRPGGRMVTPPIPVLLSRRPNQPPTRQPSRRNIRQACLSAPQELGRSLVTAGWTLGALPR